MATTRYSRGRGRRRSAGNWLFVPVLLVGGMAGLLVGGVPDFRLSDLLLDRAMPASGAAAVAARSFPICSGSVRVTCVVDGDTFWLDGTRIRIADIDTPEVGSPGCSAEADLGRKATVRLVELLSAGSFALERIDRDEDRYGRKLRIVSRDGQSIGNILVAEGLAHEWGGARRSWC